MSDNNSISTEKNNQDKSDDGDMATNVDNENVFDQEQEDPNHENNNDDDDKNRLRIDDTIEKEKMSLWRKSLLGLVLIASIGVGIGGAFLYDSYQREQDATNELNEFAESRGDLTMVNSDVVELNENDNSYALGVDSAVGSDEAPDFGTFIIRNEHNEYDRTVNLYLDYADPRSRDFFFMNQQMLRTLVENGQIELRIHPVPSYHPYSMYAAETLSQVAHRSPESFWGVSTSLLQLNEEVASVDEEVSASVFTDMIENELTRYHNIDDIDHELIVDGMFFDWLGAISEDERLTAGGVPPIIYSDGELLDSDSYYESEELRESIIDPAANDDSENPEDDISPEDIESENGEAEDSDNTDDNENNDG